MALRDIGALWVLARRVEGLFESERRTQTVLGGIEERLRALEDRMTRLEAGQGQIIAEAKGAAAATGSQAAAAVIADLAGKIGQLEERTRPLPVDMRRPPTRSDPGPS